MEFVSSSLSYEFICLQFQYFQLFPSWIKMHTRVPAFTHVLTNLCATYHFSSEAVLPANGDWVRETRFFSFAEYTELSRPSYGWHTWFTLPGTFKVDPFQGFEQLLFWNFYTFFTLILGGQFLLPQSANNGKGEFTQLQNWMRQRHSNWTICSLLNPFCPRRFSTFSL